MSIMKKLWLTSSLALLCALLLAIPAMALFGESLQASPFVAEGNGVVYAVFPGDEGAMLVSVPAAGGEPTTLESASLISNLICERGTLYYFNKLGNAMQLMKREAGGASAVMLRFTDGSLADNLLWYEDALYMLVDNLPYKVDPRDNQMSALSSTPMSEFIIQSDIIYYVSKTDTKDYEVTSADGSPLTATGGLLHSINIDGSDDEVAFAEGVSMLRASGTMLYFHNYANPYIMGDAEQWIEGTLTRIDLGTGEIKPVGPDYDWDFFAVSDGVIVYQMDTLTLYDLEGGARQVGEPQGFCSIGVIGGNIYVLDTASGTLTRADYTIDALPVTLSDALPMPSTEDGDDLDVDDDDESDTTSYTTATDDDYVLPSSGTHKLSDSLLDRLSLSTLGYARNEILARHGYVFKTAKYRNYFNSKSWYTPGGYSYNKLNSVERYNVERIKYFEAKKSGSTRSGATISDYIFKDSGKKLLTDKQVKNLDPDLLPYARNEILARHGYEFKTKVYRDYFMKRTWYSPGGYKESNLSKTEWANISLIKKYEKSSSGSSGSSGSSKDYIFANSDTKKLTKAQIRKLSKSDMGIARNEILARHGYVFKTKKYKDYFAKKSWYSAGGYKASNLNSIEWYNIDLIKACEDE